MSRDEQRAIVERSTILRGTVGSTVHGLHVGDQDDRDERPLHVCTSRGHALRGLAPAIVSRQAGPRYVGQQLR